MKRLLTSIFGAAALCVGLLTPSVAVAATPFSVTYDFDDDADFPGGSQILQGWAWTGNKAVLRYAASDVNVTPCSGNYVISSLTGQMNVGTETTTPMQSVVAGQPVTFSFKYFAEATNAMAGFGFDIYASSDQSGTDRVLVGQIEENTNWGRTWHDASFTYTPQTDGDICFTIKLTNGYGINLGGYVAYDDVAIAGMAPDAPQQGGPFTYEQNFDTISAGTPLPEGWVVEGGSYQVNVGSYFGVAARSGDNVLGFSAPSSAHGIFTPMMSCEAGKPYTMEFYYRNSGAYPRVCGVEVYVCNAQNSGAIITDAIATDAAAVMTDWKKITATFTPAEDGEYCFAIGFNALAASMYGGMVMFDDFIIEGSAPGTGEVEEPGTTTNVDFESEETFDTIATGTPLPENWVVEGSGYQVNTGTYFGVSAHSGDNVLGFTSPSSAHGIFTPLKQLVGGKPYTIEFYYRNLGSYPRVCGVEVYGCNAQNSNAIITDVLTSDAAAVMTDWKKVTATFTPEADGEYCFAIGFNALAASMFGGSVMFDDFIISGTTVGQGGDTPVNDPAEGLEPNEENLADCVELPYFEAFDGTNYDGTSALPVGWRSTGTVNWITASMRALPAVAGDYYMIAYHNTEGERDDNAYTAFFNLTANTEYKISYWLFMQGNDYNEDAILSLPSLDFTVGTEQERDFHNTIATFSQKCTEWVKQEYTFTPRESGAYCFAWMLTGPTNSGIVAIDDLRITAEGLVARVEPQFHVKGIYDLMDYTSTISFPGHALQMANTSKYADTYAWTVDGAEPATSTEANPSFVFPADGQYTIKLDATNSRGTRSTQRTVNIKLIDESNTSQQALHLQGPSDQLLQTVPAFKTDEQDYVTGFNHYYKKFAQRYDFAQETPIYLQQLQFYTINCKMVSYPADQGELPMHFVLYGANPDGSLNENDVIYDYCTTVAEGVGVSDNAGLGGFYPRNVTFPEAIELTGTFYLAMEFDNAMLVDAQDLNVGRSYLSTALIKHGHGETTLYARPYARPAGSDLPLDRWCKVSDLDNRMAGLGGYWILWASTSNPGTGVSAIGTEGNVATTFMGDNLMVSGVNAGDMINVYALNGARVASAIAHDANFAMSLPALPAGLYVVNTPAGSVKVCK